MVTTTASPALKRSNVPVVLLDRASFAGLEGGGNLGEKMGEPNCFLRVEAYGGSQIDNSLTSGTSPATKDQVSSACFFGKSGTESVSATGRILYFRLLNTSPTWRRVLLLLASAESSIISTPVRISCASCTWRLWGGGGGAGLDAKCIPISL